MTPLAFHTSMPRGTEVNASAPARSVQAQRDVWGRIETPLACTSADEQQAGIKPERAHTHTHTHTRDKICARIMIQHNTKPCVFPGACNEREHAPSSRKLEKNNNKWIIEWMRTHSSPLICCSLPLHSCPLLCRYRVLIFRPSEVLSVILKTQPWTLSLLGCVSFHTPLMTHP